MGILELHFHDSEFSWSVNPGSDSERSLSFGTGKRSGGSKSRSKSSSATRDSSERRTPSVKSKLGPLAVMAIVIGATVAFRRLRARRARRARESAQSESTSPGWRLSLFRG